jgi:hypothetical protein
MVTNNSLDLVFTNFNHVSTFFADIVFQPDLCHLPNAIETPLDLHDSMSHYEQSYCKYALGDYSLLSCFLSDYNWSYVYSDNTVDAAVDILPMLF